MDFVYTCCNKRFLFAHTCKTNEQNFLIFSSCILLLGKHFSKYSMLFISTDKSNHFLSNKLTGNRILNTFPVSLIRLNFIIHHRDRITLHQSAIDSIKIENCFTRHSSCQFASHNFISPNSKVIELFSVLAPGIFSSQMLARVHTARKY